MAIGKLDFVETGKLVAVDRDDIAKLRDTFRRRRTIDANRLYGWELWNEVGLADDSRVVLASLQHRKGISRFPVAFNQDH